ncbi:EAL domain-containing protein, partial [Psychrobacter proteolyticus]|uniref:EAL domain-containing protein n=1 Tax=Psychrobacter proteolyticus TaxID=147825 RepID=UPI00311E9C90
SALNDVNCQICVNNFGSSAKSIENAIFVQPDMVRLARSYIQDIGSAENLEPVKSIIMSTSTLISLVRMII